MRGYHVLSGGQLTEGEGEVATRLRLTASKEAAMLQPQWQTG